MAEGSAATDAPIGTSSPIVNPRPENLPAEGYRAVVRRLGSAQKPGHGVEAYTRYVNRTVGRRLAALAFLAGRTPNQVTVGSGLVSLVGIVLLAVAQPSYLIAVLVTATLLLGYALDSADGQLARLRGGGSPSGEWLDHVVDAIRLPALHATVLIGAYRFGEDLPEAYLLVPLGYLVISVVRFFAQMLSGQLRDRQALQAAPVEPTAPAPPSRRSLLRSLLLLPADYGLLCAVFLLYGNESAFAVAYTALFAVNAAWLVLTLVRRYRELTHPAPVPAP